MARTRVDPARPTPLATWLALGAALYILVPIVMLLAGWTGVAAVLGLAAALATSLGCRGGARRRT
jgi:hypothetical protein